MLSSREEIRAVGYKLASRLSDNYQELDGPDWTKHIFKQLRDFCTSELLVGAEDCFHKHHPDAKNEFLWDFIALRRERGILLAAESEQAAYNEGAVTALKHDFEKLLYVYAPLRVLVCKARNQTDADRIVVELTNYAFGCCQAFNPGAIFLIHFTLWSNKGPLNYMWQSEGAPNLSKTQTMEFVPVSKLYK